MPVKFVFAIVVFASLNAAAAAGAGASGSKTAVASASANTSRSGKSSISETESGRLRFIAYLLNQGRYMEKGEDQEQVMRQPENFAFGARYGKISSYIESSQFEDVTGQGSFAIERKRKSFLLWTNYDVLNVAQFIYFPIGLGLGVYNESVISKIQGLEDKKNGEYQWNTGLSAGVELRYRFVSLKTEAQLLYANNQNPNPSWAAFARLGLLVF